MNFFKYRNMERIEQWNSHTNQLNWLWTILPCLLYLPCGYVYFFPEPFQSKFHISTMKNNILLHNHIIITSKKLALILYSNFPNCPKNSFYSYHIFWFSTQPRFIRYIWLTCLLSLLILWQHHSPTFPPWHWLFKETGSVVLENVAHPEFACLFPPGII